MKKLRIIALIFMFAIITNLCGCAMGKAVDLTKGIEARDVNKISPDEKFISAQIDFAVDLFKNTSLEIDENILISPLSASLALSMAANGANGETKVEMEKVLGGELTIDELNGYYLSFVSDAESRGIMKIANSIWFRDDADRITVEKDFLQKNADYYGAAAYKSPFDRGTLSQINRWVSKNTDGMIDDILGDIDDSAVMYLINALAFEAEWTEIYEKKQVRGQDFFNLDGSEARVDFLHSTESIYLDDGKATGFIKYYKGLDYGFAALLPNEGTEIGEYISSLSGEGIYETFKNTDSATVVAAMPKFSFDYVTSMVDTLKVMGMEKAFGADADFSEMGKSKYGGLYINDVVQKTFIAVDEQGTKAGAATLVEVRCGSAAPEEIYYVTLNRPFVFMILDMETKIPVFIGAVTDLS